MRPHHRAQTFPKGVRLHPWAIKPAGVWGSAGSSSSVSQTHFYAYPVRKSRP